MNIIVGGFLNYIYIGSKCTCVQKIMLNACATLNHVISYNGNDNNDR